MNRERGQACSPRALLSGSVQRGRDGPLKRRRRLSDGQGARNGLRTLLERFLVRVAMWKRDEGKIRPRTAPQPVRSGLLGAVGGRVNDHGRPQSSATGCGQRARTFAAENWPPPPSAARANASANWRSVVATHGLHNTQHRGPGWPGRLAIATRPGGRGTQLLRRAKPQHPKLPASQQECSSAARPTRGPCSSRDGAAKESPALRTCVLLTSGRWWLRAPTAWWTGLSWPARSGRQPSFTQLSHESHLLQATARC